MPTRTRSANGWRAELPITDERGGVDANRLLPHGPEVFDPLSNQARMTGIPIEVDGQVVGAVGASGGNGSQDEETVRAAAGSFTGGRK